MPLASIDIGTNTIILLIAEKENNTLRTIHHECQMPRLGEDINKTRSLKPEAINRSLDVLKNYKKTIERYQCEQIILIATAACRKAQNILDFTTRVQEKLGLNIMIIPGEEEARLIHKTCAIEFKELGPPFIVLDIGGGSTEIITDSGDNVTYNSLDFGVVTLTQKFLHTNPPTAHEIESLREHIKNQLASHTVRSTQHAARPLIATAGTPTTLSAIHQKLPSYDGNKVHKSKLTRQELQELTEKLANMSLGQRCQIPCLPPKRADVIIAGCIILDTVMEKLNIQEFHISDHGLAHGILYEVITYFKFDPFWSLHY